jgi:hypothetical protein
MPVPGVVPRRAMSMMLGVVMTNLVTCRSQGWLTHISNGKRTKQTARGQQQNPSHKRRQPSMEKTILFQPPAG